jgi:hypothetical protein
LHRDAAVAAVQDVGFAAAKTEVENSAYNNHLVPAAVLVLALPSVTENS